MTDDLKARLRETWCGRSGMHDRHEINPDGPEAADRIEQLEGEIERLREALKDTASRTQAHLARDALAGGGDAA